MERINQLDPARVSDSPARPIGDGLVAPDPGSEGGRPDDSQPTVLVVDDEAHIVDFIAALLEEEGCRVIRAYDGEQAWRLAETEQPDLVISDVMMPRLNGLDLLNRFRESGDGRSTLPVILMSAVARQVPRADVAFIPKPFDIDQMLNAVSSRLAAD